MLHCHLHIGARRKPESPKHRDPSRIIRSNGPPTAQKFRLPIFLNQIDILMSHAKLAFEIDPWLIRESHARLEQYLRVPLVQVG